MNQIFKIEKSPYEDDVKIFSKGSIEITDNSIICLVGCNGSGKSTVMSSIKRQLKIKQIKLELYAGLFEAMSGLSGGKLYDRDDAAYFDFDKETDNQSTDMQMIFNKAGLAYSSTGEGIIQRYGRLIQLIGTTIREGKYKELYFFFDDCDAGTSIDMIQDIKYVINLIKDDCEKRGITYHFILSANSYEMCKDFDCISVHNFTHKKFRSYESFKKFVLRSRAIKDKRPSPQQEEQ